ncbi:tetraacyldisaccharide 4'-kinase [bacterium]
MNRFRDYYFKLIFEKSGLHPFNIILLCLSYIYLIILKLKYLLYKTKILTQKKLNVPVISIGNITLGGTGKTPMVVKIAKIFETTKKIGIITRGYKRKTDEPLIVTKKNLDVDKMGDEPCFISKKLSNVCIGISRDKYKIAEKMIHDCNTDLLILDDGFQSACITRDIDIVLVDVLNPFGNGFVLPRGILRQPKRSLKRADIIILTKTNFALKENVERLKIDLETKFNKQVFESEYVPMSLNLLGGDNKSSLDEIKNKDISILTGISNPDNFAKTLEGLEAKVVEKFAYPDHYWYKQDDILDIVNKCKTDIIIITEKDTPKLMPFIDSFKGKKVYELIMDVKLQDELIKQAIIKAI